MSIAHSGDYAAVAVSMNSEVGIDIEYMRSLPKADMESILNADEQQVFNRLQQNQQNDWFYERWCQNYIDYFNFDGSHQEAGEFTSAWGGKNKYCQKCNKKLN